MGTVNDDGSINVFLNPAPPRETVVNAVPFAEYLKLNGTGSESFLLNGSVTSQDMFIKAQDIDIYINTLSFIIADAGATLRNFGALAALTNGLEFYFFNQENGLYTIESGLKSNLDFIRLANFEPAFGTGAEAFQGKDVIGASEGYFGIIDLEDVFGLPWGIRLRANSTDRIGFIIKDNISTIDLMNIKAFGIKVK